MDPRKVQRNLGQCGRPSFFYLYNPIKREEYNMIALVDLGIAVLIFSIGFLIFKAALQYKNDQTKKDQ